ncbi:hypothetical protein JM18_007287 [Phytophthora kernoviae]|uniref:AMP-dependent synthetase/ligase domain-containing protein n=2 Tax=Phytophthora kernoviae TaxID=325452 RepID=A0A921SE15_9STRA|nr:hypothetical protein G195_008834 [Phytophthora kernoviae 00238/432]KAG2520068.1 hypothetical protein JM18_007287 [Phytophthora kernoviae]
MGGVWKTDQLATVRVDTAANGTNNDIGSREPTIIVKVFQDVVARDPTGRALSIKKDSECVTHTWQQYYNICQRFAKALIHIGVQPHEAVNILGPNCPEWLFANVGSIMAGAVAAGIYPTSKTDACQHISAHCEARVVVMSDKEQLDKYLSVLDQLPALKALVVWNEADVPQEAKFRVPVYAFSEFLRLGDNVEPSLLDARIAAQQPNHCCELIYTSGSEVYFADPDALRGSLLGTLQEVRPNFFCGVPRVWEKMMESLKDKIGGAPEGLKKSLIMWAMEKGTDHTMQTQFGSTQRESFRFWIADYLLLSKIRHALGLDECTTFLTGAAATAPSVVHFFGSLNMPLYELYGLTESTGPHTFSMPNKWKLGSVGLPLEGTRTRIDPDTGEIQYTGRHVFMGYLNDEKATNATLDDDGWLYTGDVGVLDKDGFLSVTGRIKEIIITSGGENIPPVLIENELKAELRALSNVVVIGEKRKFLTFLCSLRVEPDPVTAIPTDKLDKVSLAVAEEIGSNATTVSEAQTCEKFGKYIEEGVARANAKAASRAQHLQKFCIIPHDFSIDGNELTPTMKLKRSVVEHKYSRKIEQMYA